MRICNLTSLALTLIILPLQGQPVKISGSGNGYAGTELRIFRQSDPVTKSMVPLQRAACDTSGRFSFEVPVNGTETIIINAGIFSFYIYATNGTEYELKLPDLIPKTEEEEQNSYFSPTRLIPEIVNNNSDINNLIRNFDAEFDPIFNRVADRVMYNVKLDEIPALIEKLNGLSVPGATEFYRNFVTFRLIMLNLVARGDYPGRIEDSILINRRFASDNPAYIDLTEQIFSRYFRTLSGGVHKAEFGQAVSSLSLKELKKTITLDGKASEDNLQEYIIILNLFSAFYEGTIARDKVLLILSSIQSTGSSLYIRDLARTVKEKLSVLYAGTLPPGFQLSTSGGKQFSPGDFSGKYLIISFARSDNAFSLAEYGILKTWYANYNQHFQVVTILRDDEFGKAAVKMVNYGFSWIILDGSSADYLEYQYDVKLYPSFLLVDPEGKIIMKNCPFPTENLERLIARLTIGKSN